MAKFTTYENSKFASFCSILGSIAIIFGAYALFEEELGVIMGIIGLAIGFVLKMLGGFISQLKSQRAARKNQSK